MPDKKNTETKQEVKEPVKNDTKNGSKKGLVAVIVAVFIAAACFGGWQLRQARIADMQDLRIEALQSHLDAGDYREAEQAEIAAIIEEGETAIRATEDKDEASKIRDDAIAKLDELKTDAEYTKEEKENAEQKDLELKTEEAKEEVKEATAAYESAKKKAAAAKSKAKKKSKKKSSSSSNGCVGGGSDAFY